MRIIGIGPKETFFIGQLSPDMPAEQIGLEVGDQPIAIDGKTIHSFYQVVDYLSTTENNQSIAFTVRKGGEKGPEKTYDLIPVEKELANGTALITRKLIGFTPEFKIITTYPNPITLIVRRVKDMYLTLSGLVSPQSDVKMRNMSGPVGIVNHLSIFAKIGFKKLLWFVVFINVNLAILNLIRLLESHVLILLVRCDAYLLVCVTSIIHLFSRLDIVSPYLRNVIADLHNLNNLGTLSTFP